jgi:hypothetical protein
VLSKWLSRDLTSITPVLLKLNEAKSRWFNSFARLAKPVADGIQDCTNKLDWAMNLFQVGEARIMTHFAFSMTSKTSGRIFKMFTLVQSTLRVVFERFKRRREAFISPSKRWIEETPILPDLSTPR